MTLVLALLGRFYVEIDGAGFPAESWRRRRAAEIVKILALDEDHRVHREQLMDALWPEMSPTAAGANLRKAIYHVRGTLESPEAIVSNDGIVELWPGQEISVDALQFEKAAHTAISSSDPTRAEEAARLYSGELLPDDRYAPWALEPRERLRSLAVRVMKSAELWDRVLDVDPADEEAHRALMRRALDDGDRSGAVRQFEKLRERLRIDLAMGPGPESVALYERALLGRESDPGNDAELARTLLARSFVALNQGQLDVAERDAEEAHRLAVAGGLATEFNEATALLSIVSSLRGRWRDLFRSEFAEAVQHSDEVAERIFDAHVCVTEYHLYGPAGHVGLLAFASELGDIATGADSLRGQAVAELLSGEAELFSGHLAEAEQRLEKAISLHAEAGASGGQVIAMQRLAECALARGDLESALGLSNEGLLMARRSRLAPHLVSRMHEGVVRASRGAAAVSAVHAGEVELAQEMICPPCSAGFRIASTVALAANGDIAGANERLGLADDIATNWPDGYWHAALLEARGAVQRASGAELEAVDSYRAAAEGYGALGRPVEAARCVDSAESVSASSA